MQNGVFQCILGNAYGEMKNHAETPAKAIPGEGDTEPLPTGAGLGFERTVAFKDWLQHLSGLQLWLGFKYHRFRVRKHSYEDRC